MLLGKPRLTSVLEKDSQRSDMKLKKGTWTSLIIWAMIFLSPLLISNSADLTWCGYFRFSIIPVFLLVTFLLNYYWLVPVLLLRHRITKFVVLNAVMISILSWSIHWWMVLPFWCEDLYYFRDHMGVIRWNVVTLLLLKNSLALIASGGVATAMRLSDRWALTEAERRKAEQARLDAELKTLRSEIHPHFLLNTLNNIYALIAFDAQKAQEAVWSLGDMLRHILYDNQQSHVSLESEITFINEYIKLMSLRLRDEVKVSTHYDLPSPCNVMIVPNVLIGLVENAFKHGVSSTEPSFIDISIKANEDRCEICVANSNYPQKRNDDTSHGVGMAYIKKRLDLEYNDNYSWTYGPVHDNKNYESKIILYDTKLHHH